MEKKQMLIRFQKWMGIAGPEPYESRLDKVFRSNGLRCSFDARFGLPLIAIAGILPRLFWIAGGDCRSRTQVMDDRP
jgi:hypothetical protein